MISMLNRTSHTNSDLYPHITDLMKIILGVIIIILLWGLFCVCMHTVVKAMAELHCLLVLLRPLAVISGESGRIAMTDILTNVFRTVIVTRPEDLLPIVYLTVNRVAPAHYGIELGIGDAAIIKTIAETFGKSEAQVKSQLKV